MFYAFDNNHLLRFPHKGIFFDIEGGTSSAHIKLL